MKIPSAILAAKKGKYEQQSQSDYLPPIGKALLAPCVVGLPIFMGHEES
jgi:hypothetical protein